MDHFLDIDDDVSWHATYVYRNATVTRLASSCRRASDASCRGAAIYTLYRPTCYRHDASPAALRPHTTSAALPTTYLLPHHLLPLSHAALPILAACHPTTLPSAPYQHLRDTGILTFYCC